MDLGKSAKDVGDFARMIEVLDTVSAEGAVRGAFTRAPKCTFTHATTR